MQLGHGFGLPHRDTRTWNRDLGSCLDYTNNYSRNKKPDNDIDFQNLSKLYGKLPSNTRRLRGKSNVYNPSQNMADIALKRRWDYEEEGRLLHTSDVKEVYENDLGNGVKVVTTLLRA